MELKLSSGLDCPHTWVQGAPHSPDVGWEHGEIREERPRLLGKLPFLLAECVGKTSVPPLSAAVPTLTSSLLYQTNFSDGAEVPNPLVSGQGLQLTVDPWSLEKGHFPLPPLPRPHSFSQGQSPRRHFCLPAPYLGGGGGHMSQLSRCQNGLFTVSTLTLPRLWLAVPCNFTETFCVHALTSGYPYTLSRGASRL